MQVYQLEAPLEEVLEALSSLSFVCVVVIIVVICEIVILNLHTVVAM